MMARRQLQKGLSLIEAVVAVAILAIISAPIFGAFMVARAAQAETTNRAIAQAIARSRLEGVVNTAGTSWSAVVSQAEAADPTYKGMRVRIDVANKTIVGTTDALKEVTVTISWTGAKQRPLTYQLSTLLEKRSA